jgi:GrpB-like predicted nucleotidyltransferase (UPF0157 family)
MANAATHGEALVEIVPYDPAWPARFAQERALLEQVLGPLLAGPIEHIGSTAIPGMLGKPIIDIMVAVADLEPARPAIAAAELAGYVHYPYRADVMHWFCKPSAAQRTHHLHLVPHASQLWHDRLAFRDRLRADRTLAAEYASLKTALARRFCHDREAYTDAKGPFVARVLAGARDLDPNTPRAPGPGTRLGGGAIADGARR